MTTTIEPRHREALARLMPYIKEAMADGHTPTEAFVIAHERFQRLLTEILDGKTDRAKGIREAICKATYAKLREPAS